MSITIDESGMRFGPYAEDSCFVIEKSQIHQRIQEQVKTAEFLLLITKKPQFEEIWIVEAKQSSPDPKKLDDKFDIFLNKVAQKLTHSLELYLALRLNRHSHNDLPPRFQQIDLAKAQFRLLLVLNEPKKDRLDPLNAALNKKLAPIRKIWNLGPNAIGVMNEELAQKYGLIVATP